MTAGTSYFWRNPLNNGRLGCDRSVPTNWTSLLFRGSSKKKNQNRKTRKQLNRWADEQQTRPLTPREFFPSPFFDTPIDLRSQLSGSIRRHAVNPFMQRVLQVAGPIRINVRQHDTKSGRGRVGIAKFSVGCTVQKRWLGCAAYLRSIA